MSRNKFYKETISALLAKADVLVGGERPWDMRVNDENVYAHIFNKGSLGLGESYMAGMWDCNAIDQMIYRLIVSGAEKHVKADARAVWYKLQAKLWNKQSVKRSLSSIHRHYDIGNDLFEAMLDKRMMYSCAYWKDAATLEEAQDNKLDLVCRKIYLEKGQRVLDIGCGWGGFAGYAAERYGVKVVGITLSGEQLKIARKRYAHLPVDIRLQDYRNIDEKFDRIVSIGMFEHVGYKNYGAYMDMVQQALNPDGLFLLHTIGGNRSVAAIDPWINTYIFPDGMIPSVSQIGKAAEDKLVMEDWHNFGTFYDLTLMEWLKRFRKAWPDLKDKYGDSFYRMWEYYLSCCAATFRAKRNHLWQIVFSATERREPYVSVR